MGDNATSWKQTRTNRGGTNINLLVGKCRTHGIPLLDTTIKYRSDGMLSYRQLRVNWNGGSYLCVIKAGTTSNPDYIFFSVRIKPREGAAPLDMSTYRLIDAGLRVMLLSSERKVNDRVKIEEDGEITILLPIYTLPERPK